VYKKYTSENKYALLA